jgi:membrane protease YdiL (CAAX protease family)
MRHLALLKQVARDWPLLTFFALAYAMAWVAWLPLVLSSAGLGLLPITLGLEWSLPGTYAPLIAALIVQRVGTGRWRIGPVLGPWPQLASGLAVGAIAIAAATLLLPIVWLSGTDFHLAPWRVFLAYPMAIAVALGQGGPIGEEPGWRGFALPRMQARWQPLPAAVGLGIVWAFWHAPLFLVSTWEQLPIAAYVALIIALSIVMSTASNLANGSIIVAIVLHAMFNGAPRVFGPLVVGAPIHPLFPFSSGIVLAGAMVFVAIVVIASTGGRLAARRPG